MLKHAKNIDEIQQNIERCETTLEVERTTMNVLDEKIIALQRQKNVLGKTIANTEALLRFWSSVSHESQKDHYVNTWACDLHELAQLGQKEKAPFLRDVKNFLNKLEKDGHVELQYDPFSADFLPAAISSTGIYFNGCMASGAAQFRLNLDRSKRPDEQEGIEHNHCLTVGKPYEIAVVGVLLLAEKHFPQIYKVNVNPDIVAKFQGFTYYFS